MKKVIGWLVILAAVAGIGWLVWQRIEEQNSENTGKAKKKAAAIAVEAVLPETKDMRDVKTFTGTLKPWSSFEVAPKVSGRLEELNFDIGDPVPGGAVIARIEDTEYKQVVDQTAADLDVARAELSEARVMLDLRRREYERQKILTEKNVGTAAQYESAETAYQAQAAAYAKSEAEVKRRQAILDNARLKLNDCTVTADWGGEDVHRYVASREVDEGTLMAENQALLTVAELDRLYAVIYAIERDYPSLKIGQVARLSTDAYPGEVFEGKISRIAQVLQDNTRQAAVQIEVPNKDLRLKPGMYVRVQMEFAFHPGAQVVPRNAVIKRNDKTGVFKLSARDGKAVFVPVETGIATRAFTEILSPKLNFPVITLGNHLLTDGVDIRIPADFQIRKPDDAEAGEQETARL